MREVFINSPEDMEWLFEVHNVKDVRISWEPKSAIIYGNEDCPDRIDLYPVAEPNWNDPPLIGLPDGLGGYTFSN